MSAINQTIAQILDDAEMPRFQDPSILLRSDVAEPFYYIRPVIPRLTPNGIERKQEVRRLGLAKDLNSKKKREAAKQAIMAEINKGSKFLSAQIPLSYLIERYRSARLPQLAATTQRKYSAHIGKHIEKDLGALRLCDLEPSIIQEWLVKKTCISGRKGKEVDRPMGSATKQDLLHILSALFDQARTWKMFEGSNPCKDVDLGRLEPVRQKYLLTEGQTQMLIEALYCDGTNTLGMTGPDVALMVRLIVASGWRISEVLGLQKSAIDGEFIVMRQRWSRGDMALLGKTQGSERRNFIGPLADELRARRGKFIFTADTGLPPDDRDLMQHILRPCCQAIHAYRLGFGFHSFRRLNISWRQQAGASPYEAMILAGHTRPATTMHYTIVPEDRERGQVENMLNRIDRSATGKTNLARI